MMIANFFKITILAFVLSVLTIAKVSAMCSPCPPGWTCVSSGGFDNCEPPPSSAEVPIDGGVLGLLVVGAVYGAKKIYDHKKVM